MSQPAVYHVPVLLHEVLEALQLKPGLTVLDGTLGGGGHAAAILQQIMPGGQLIGFDQDAAAIQQVQQTLGKQYQSNQLIVKHDNIRNVTKYITKIEAALLDLGVSLWQLHAPNRGFSFQQPNDVLDMRMDQRQIILASTLLNDTAERELCRILREYGEEPQARVLARTIVQWRKTKRFRIVQDLLDCLWLVKHGSVKSVHHLAARTFQALRIAVNQELDWLPAILQDIISILSPGGRLAVITFHSLEDRIVKQTFKAAARNCICAPDVPVCICTQQASVRLITTRPIKPTVAEINRNAQAHSALLRVIEKI
ncbi:MAG: 16S rRNA (cytosine(1402)-N(4))-methyltransferase RsmH [Patescibacteria group bacterium]|jgi:16S rRNA (cytosine1402-N4)-methyltransferase